MTVDPASILIGMALGFILRTSGQSININGSSNASVQQPTHTEVDVKPLPFEKEDDEE